MKKNYLQLICALLIASGCSQEASHEVAKSATFNGDAQDAVNVFLEYHRSLNTSLARSADAVNIMDVVEMNIPIPAKEATTTLSRAGQTEQIKLHRITFSCKGEQGMSIVSTDERIRSNFMYCEKGTIEDTAYIEPVAEYIREVIPELCAYDLERYNSGGVDEETLSRATQPTIYLDMKTKWGQHAPYNERLTKINCDGQNRYPLVGCTGVAIAQTLVFLLPDGYNGYPINEMRNTAYYFSGFPNASTVAQFMCDVTSSYTTHECDGSGAKLSATGPVLANWGFFENVGYIYKSTDSLDKSKFYNSLQLGCPTLMSGSNGKGNSHTWILHGQRYNGKTREVYCNYGWTGECDGWYSDWQRPQRANGEYVISGSYYRDNKYMYFLQNKSSL